MLHLGSMEMKDYTGKLVRNARTRRKRFAQIRKTLRRSLSQTREAKKEKFVARTNETLRKLLPEAEKRGLKLGCENRQALEEIPVESDFQFFFREFRQPEHRLLARLRPRADQGKPRLHPARGCISESLADRLAGFHIHDVQFPARDHCAPGTGMIDFAALKPFVKPEHIKVFELSPSLPVEAVKAGIAHIKKIWGEE